MSARVLIACEFSGTVRDAFAARGWDAWSCDLLPTERPGNHLVGDVLPFLSLDWDLIVAHPPCTRLCVSGARWFRGREAEQADAVRFVLSIAAAPCPRIAIENPIGVLSSRWRKPDQIVHPWQFGHGESKATCLWVKGLRPLTPSHVVAGRSDRLHRVGPGPDRWKIRSRTYAGIARAMADQWTADFLGVPR